MLASEMMDRKEIRKEYERKVCERLRKAGMAVEYGASVSKVFRVLKGAVGHRALKHHRKESA